MKHSIILIFIVFIGVNVNAQCKTFFIGVNGDTLNCVDYKNKKTGKWINSVQEVRGEPGYEEEGVYDNGKKEGLWKKFSLDGEKIAEEYYRWGVKDGPSRYYKGTDEVLIREENWSALDPARVGEKVKVLDPSDPSGRKYVLKVITDDGVTLKNGDFKYFDYDTKRLIKAEYWIMDSLAKQPDNKKPAGGKDKNNGKQPVEKPKAVLDFEKSNKGKKNKFVDGTLGGG